MAVPRPVHRPRHHRRSLSAVDRADPDALRNSRTPRANLESVYGGGPVGSPYLYERDDPARLLIGEGGADVPRNAEGVALIGDPRNDSHLFMNQLQVAFLRAHNLLVDRLRADGEPEASVFDEARFSLTWHYQWVLLYDFLPSLIGAELAARLLDGGGERYRRRRGALHPVRVRRRRIPLRPLADPPPIPDQRSTARPAAVPGPDRIHAREPGDGGRLVAALRRSRAPGGAAGQADRRTPARVADQPAAGDRRRGRRRRLPVARRARPPARSGHRAALGRGGRPRARRRTTVGRRVRARRAWLGRRDAALVLHPARGQRPP